MKAVNLRTEYLKNPIGIDICKPRLFWNCDHGISQKAYRIVAENEELKILWDSSKIESNQMTHIAYGGELSSGNQIFWKVLLWDENNQEGDWSESASFEMGLMQAMDWKATWITGDYHPQKKKRYPVDCFRKNLQIKQIVKKARLYITSCGLYEANVNGERVGKFVLAPGHTDYRKRIQYQTYDVTKLIKEGDNTIEVWLADGWYRGSCGAWGLVNQYGTETKLLAQLELTYKGGSTEIICTDGTWEWSNDGPIRFADNKDGEIVEAFRMSSYDRKAKETVCTVIPSSSNNVEIMEHEKLNAKLIQTPSGKQVLDFGQNIAGYLSFFVRAKIGQKIILRFGEMIDQDGEFTQNNIQCKSKKKTTPLQQIIYHCKDGVNHYKTRFAIFGFRYVLIETDVVYQPEDFTAIAVYSDLDTTASFDSSNQLLNKFVKNTLWSTKNNSADVPTDCPTRERHGWTGDSQLFAVTVGYLMNYIPFARKHLRDLTDWQRADGAFPQIAPYGGVDFYMNTMNGSVGWADAGVLIPYRYWKLYGDEALIRDNYDAMARYTHFMMRRCGKRGLMAKSLGLTGEAKKYAVNTGQSYGEWAEPKEVWPMKWTDMILPHPEVSTAYTAYIMQVMEEIAIHLGKAEDAKEYHLYAVKVKQSYQALVDTQEYTLDTDRQARLVRPLYFDLLSPGQKEFAKKRLIQALEHYNWCIGTGFLSTPLILYVLSEIHIEYAYRLLENEEMPGWLFMPRIGATTVWESWEGTSAQGGIASLNHYSKGACLEWVFKIMCGIQIYGRNQFIIAPQPGGHFTHAELSYQSIYGEVKVRWEKKGERFVYQIHIPANTTAELHLPGAEKRALEAGDYTYGY
jgi:alpha-L-rhamnosidase